MTVTVMLTVTLVLVALILVVLLRIWWLTQDTHWQSSALYEKVNMVGVDVRLAHRMAIDAHRMATEAKQGRSL